MRAVGARKSLPRWSPPERGSGRITRGDPVRSRRVPVGRGPSRGRSRASSRWRPPSCPCNRPAVRRSPRNRARGRAGWRPGSSGGPPAVPGAGASDNAVSTSVFINASATPRRRRSGWVATLMMCNSSATVHASRKPAASSLGASRPTQMRAQRRSTSACTSSSTADRRAMDSTVSRSVGSIGPTCIEAESRRLSWTSGAASAFGCAERVADSGGSRAAKSSPQVTCDQARAARSAASNANLSEPSPRRTAPL